MEALSSSALQIKRFSDRSSGIQIAKTSNKHCAFLRISPTSTHSLRRASRVSALAREVSDDGEEDSRLDNDNGVVRLVSEETLSLSQVTRKKKIRRKVCNFPLYFLVLRRFQ